MKKIINFKGQLNKKLILMIIFFAIFIFDNNVLAKAYYPYLLGDINMDNKVDNNDVTILQNHLSNNNLTKEQQVLADIDFNGSVFADDLELLKKIVSGETKTQRFGDMDNDGKISAADVALFKTKLDSFTELAHTIPYGDINLDGEYNDEDYQLLQSFVGSSKVDSSDNPIFENQEKLFFNDLNSNEDNFNYYVVNYETDCYVKGNLYYSYNNSSYKETFYLKPNQSSFGSFTDNLNSNKYLIAMDVQNIDSKTCNFNLKSVKTSKKNYFESVALQNNRYKLLIDAKKGVITSIFDNKYEKYKNTNLLADKGISFGYENSKLIDYVLDSRKSLVTLIIKPVEEELYYTLNYQINNTNIKINLDTILFDGTKRNVFLRGNFNPSFSSYNDKELTDEITCKGEASSVPINFNTSLIANDDDYRINIFSKNIMNSNYCNYKTSKEFTIYQNATNLARLTNYQKEFIILTGTEEEVKESLANINKITVTFETNGGSDIAKQVLELNDLINKPADPTKEGFVFAGWYLDSDFTMEYDFDTKVTNDITLYAKWVSNKKDELPENPNTGSIILTGITIIGAVGLITFITYKKLNKKNHIVKL